MKVRNDDKKTFIASFNHITYTIKPNKAVEIPQGAWNVWHGSTEIQKRWARKLMGGQLPHLVPVDSRKKDNVDSRKKDNVVPGEKNKK